MSWQRDPLSGEMRWQESKPFDLSQCRVLSAEEFYSDPAIQQTLRQIKSERDAEARRQELATMPGAEYHDIRMIGKGMPGSLRRPGPRRAINLETGDLM